MSAPTQPEVKVWDGSNIAVVKPASTPAAATDPGVVVNVSPNSPATVVGTSADGAAAVGNPVAISGVDGGGLTQALLVDTSGRPQVAGAAAAGSAVAGNPVLTGGSDGTNVRTIATSTTGHPIIEGAGVAGTPAGGVASVQGVSGGQPVPVSGTVTANTQKSTASTPSGVASSATDVTVLASNANRLGASFYNSSTATLYLNEGAAASIASGGYVVAIPPGGYYEMPMPIYSGSIHGIWSAANGFVNVKENT